MEYSTALQNANTSATSHNTSIKVVSLSVNSSSDTLQTQEQYTIRLTGLQNDTAYNFTLTAQTRFGILDLDSGGTFTTLDPGKYCYAYWDVWSHINMDHYDTCMRDVLPWVSLC